MELAFFGGDVDLKESRGSKATLSCWWDDGASSPGRAMLSVTWAHHQLSEGVMGGDTGPNPLLWVSFMEESPQIFFSCPLVAWVGLVWGPFKVPVRLTRRIQEQESGGVPGCSWSHNCLYPHTTFGSFQFLEPQENALEPIAVESVAFQGETRPRDKHGFGLQSRFGGKKEEGSLGSPYGGYVSMEVRGCWGKGVCWPCWVVP